MGKFMKGLLKFLLFDLTILIIGFVFFFRMTKTVDVTWTKADLKSGITKTKAVVYDIGKLNLVDSFDGKIVCNGQNQVSDSFTNTEVSAIISSANDNLGPIKDVKIKFLGNNEAEANLTLNQNLIDMIKSNAAVKEKVKDYAFILDAVAGTPIYIKGKLNSFTENTMDLQISELSLGNLQIGQDQVTNIQTNLNVITNEIIRKYPGFSIKNLTMDEGKLNFSGTVPAKID